MLREETFSENKLKASVLFFGISLLLMLVFYLPEDFADHGPVLCLWRRLGFHFCWGCGMTRALWHLLHGEFQLAFRFNHLVVIVAPILFGLYLQLGYESFTGKRLDFVGFWRKKILRRERDKPSETGAE